MSGERDGELGYGGSFCFDEPGYMCDHVLRWKFNYFFGIPRWGEDLSTEAKVQESWSSGKGNSLGMKRIPYLPKNQWVDESEFNTQAQLSKTEVEKRIAENGGTTETTSNTRRRPGADQLGLEL